VSDVNHGSFRCKVLEMRVGVRGGAFFRVLRVSHPEARIARLALHRVEGTHALRDAAARC
jgi:hypothetical protein